MTTAKIKASTGRPRRGGQMRPFGVRAPARVVRVWREASAQVGWSVSRLLLEAWRGCPAVAPVFDPTPTDPMDAASFAPEPKCDLRLSFPTPDHEALRAWAKRLDLPVGVALTLAWCGWAAKGGLVNLHPNNDNTTDQGE